MNATVLNRSRFEVRDLTPAIGAEIHVDATALSSGAFADRIIALLDERIVLLFPKINLTDEQQTAVARTIGTVQRDGDEDILNVTLDKNANGWIPSDVFAPTRYWHIDNAGAGTGIPARAGILSARRVAAEGGQTEFANLYAAYEALPEADKQLIASLRAIHSFEAFQRCAKPDPSVAELKFWQSMPPTSQPLVWTHDDGRKSLFIGQTTSHVEGMTMAEGRMLLCRLQEWATQPQFKYRHEWSVGDMVIWNNTGAMHRAIPYAADSGRMMSRSGISGTELVK